MSLRSDALAVTLSGLADRESVPLPCSKGGAFPYVRLSSRRSLLPVDGCPTVSADVPQKQRCSPPSQETRNIRQRGKRGHSYPPEGLQRIEKLATQINRPDQWRSTKGGADLFVGVDLGTTYVVVVVIDGNGDTVAGTMQFAAVAREGLIIDYIGAIEIVKKMLESMQSSLGIKLHLSATAFPPKTESANVRTTEYILESVGLEVLKVVDEPSAANRVLKIQNGAIVDIGGGTTGIAIIEDGEITYTGDEPTGGTHLNLVIAGRKGISFEEAETYKMEHQEDTLEIVFPVIQKMAAIVRSHVGERNVEVVHLVGGTSDLLGIERVMEDELGIAVEKPYHPQLVTPLGIALACLEER